MGVGYCLINNTKKEKITYLHLPATTARELTGNSVTSAVTTWYLLKNTGDEIGFVPDQYYEKDWPFREISWEDINIYNDVTDRIISELIDNEILKDKGIQVFDEDEPEVFIRCLNNIW